MPVKLKKLGKSPSQKVAVLRTSVRAAMQPILAEHVALRRQVTDSWSRKRSFPDSIKKFQNNRPVYKAKIRNSSNGLSFEVFGTAPAADGANVSVYRLLNRGTSVRYAIMSSDFKRKTAPNSLTSSAGVGHMQAIGKKPLKGIDARNFDETANAELFDATNVAIDKGFRLGFDKL